MSLITHELTGVEHHAAINDAGAHSRSSDEQCTINRYSHYT